MMNREILKGEWTNIKGKIKTHWGKLTNDDITKINGEYDKLVGEIEKSYGYSKKQAHQEVDDFFDNLTSDIK